MLFEILWEEEIEEDVDKNCIWKPVYFFFFLILSNSCVDLVREVGGELL